MALPQLLLGGCTQPKVILLAAASPCQVMVWSLIEAPSTNGSVGSRLRAAPLVELPSSSPCQHGAAHGWSVKKVWSASLSGAAWAQAAKAAANSSPNAHPLTRRAVIIFMRSPHQPHSPLYAVRPHSVEPPPKGFQYNPRKRR